MAYSGPHLIAIGVAALAGAGVGGFRTRCLSRRLDAAERAASTDPLTGLANRTGLRRDFQRLVARSEPDEQLGLVLLDLNHFKPINDRYGHETGDRVLAEIGERLQHLRVHGQHVSAARLGGDEFVVVFVTGGTGAAERVTADAARAIEGAVERPVVVGTTSIQLRVSAGIASCPVRAAGLRDLLTQADAAMYRVKRNGSRPQAVRSDVRIDTMQRAAMSEKSGFRTVGSLEYR